MGFWWKIKIRHVALCGLILANLALGTYVLYPRKVTESARRIPSKELTENPIVRDGIKDLLVQSNNDQIAVALLSTASTTCATGTLVEIFKKAAARSQNAKFVILLPSSFSRQELENFQGAFKTEFKVELAKERLSSEWLALAEKYEALGVVIVIDQGNIFVSQEREEISNLIGGFE